MKSRKDSWAVPERPEKAVYRGRFAPSPTGLLHAGSLLTALASWLDARTSDGIWLLRMEDLDPPRESKEAADGILFALDALHLHWNGPVLYQSQRIEAYQDALATLVAKDRIFPCTCSRQDFGNDSRIYPGTCRERLIQPDQAHALRCRVDDRVISVEDRLQGHYSQNLIRDTGDFVIKRKDGLFAYQLAVVVDDAMQGITDIVRGIDLLDSTPRQLFLQELLDCSQPRYAHLPVLVDKDGNKFSKQQGAAPVDVTRPAEALFRALAQLQQEPPEELLTAPTQDILQWAVNAWNPGALNNQTSLREIS